MNKLNKRIDKKQFLMITATFLLLIGARLPALGGNILRGGQTGTLPQIIQEHPESSLSGEEKAGIFLMREEEKLARDMYTALYDKWNIPIFKNIAKSEQAHKNWMELLIHRYGLEDPGERASRAGSYESEELQKVYDQLLEKGLRSLTDAFEVGATVEDLDIADLERLIAESDNSDVRVIYQNLNKGSRNHLRSFNSQLSRLGGSYTPQYISDTLFRAIVNSRKEQGAISDPGFTFP